MKKLYCPECSAYLEGGDGECKDCHCGWKQPVSEEKQSTLEQLQEENAKLKQAIISIYTNTEEITLNGEDGYYAVKQSVIDDVIDLAEY
ncbi:hypothetical protein AB7W56_15180 [Providencia rettgeri]|uniref:hypothetical protein n=1 Tax=Providencia TaxID=586 RepID=UPI00226D4128|nr:MULTISPECIES: hypothetical protein [Providencia]MCX9108222.1 hypothetical protein [Providencia rettgeri]